MRLKQYRYPFKKLSASSNESLPSEVSANTAYIRIPSGKTITHLGIQLPYRPFISYRHKEDGTRPATGQCAADIVFNSNNSYIVNATGILEFDNISRSDEIVIYLPLLEDKLYGDVDAILRETIIEIGYED